MSRIPTAALGVFVMRAGHLSASRSVFFRLLAAASGFSVRQIPHDARNSLSPLVFPENVRNEFIDRLDNDSGGILIVWDCLFGSHATESEKVGYGLTKPVGTSDPLQYNLRKFIAIYKCMQAVDIWSERLKVLYKNPGWDPDSLKRKRLNKPKAL